MDKMCEHIAPELALRHCHKVVHHCKRKNETGELSQQYRMTEPKCYLQNGLNERLKTKESTQNAIKTEQENRTLREGEWKNMCVGVLLYVWKILQGSLFDAKNNK